MALNKIQKLLQKIVETEKVKQVVSEVQTVTHDIQNKLQKLSADEAVKKYKELAQKVVTAENELHREVLKVVAQVKKSAEEVEKGLDEYKEKAKVQRAKIEQALLTKAAKFSKQEKKSASTTKPAAKKTKTVKKAVKKKARKK